MIGNDGDMVRVEVTSGTNRAEFSTPLIGRHNLLNILGAIASVEHFGFELSDIADAVESLHTVPGRLEYIPNELGMSIVVDYAHTPHALSQAIQAVGERTPGRVICVAGAGGNRDRGKREPMGAALAEADLVCLTSDNPRDENPAAIVLDIERGIPASHPRHLELDRRKAILWGAAAGPSWRHRADCRQRSRRLPNRPRQANSIR